MKKLVMSAVAVSCMLFSVASFAANNNSQANASKLSLNSKFYAGVSLGYVSSDWKTMVRGLDPVEPTYSDWKNGKGGLGFGTFVGYSVTMPIGVEVGYSHAPAVDVTVHENYPTPNVNVTPIKISNNILYADVVLSAQLPNMPVWLYAKVGPGIQMVHINKESNGVLKSTNAFGLYASLGVSYYMGDHISIAASASGITGHTQHSASKYAANTFMYGLNVNYIF